MPPCYDANGQSIPHTKFGQVSFPDARTLDILFTFLNGKIMFAYWCIVGDDFDVTRWMFADFPLDLSALSPAELRTKADGAIRAVVERKSALDDRRDAATSAGDDRT